MGQKIFTKEWCRYEFSADELKEVASIMAEKTQELDDIELQKKSAMSSFKERLDSCKMEVVSHARLYKDGYEMRDIECEEIKDFDSGIIQYIRTDTGTIARTKKMSAEDRQRGVADYVPQGE